MRPAKVFTTNISLLDEKALCGTNRNIAAAKMMAKKMAGPQIKSWRTRTHASGRRN
jgi:hypothetical protein